MVQHQKDGMLCGAEAGTLSKVPELPTWAIHMFIGSEVPANSWQVKWRLYFLCIVVELGMPRRKRTPETTELVCSQARHAMAADISSESLHA